MAGLFRVAWKCVVTSVMGHGEYVDYASAKEWADHGNQKWGSDPWARRSAWRLELNAEDDGSVILHWVEGVAQASGLISTISAVTGST
jgi:hypothetical protein